jgi:hypothetical protein
MRNYQANKQAEKEVDRKREKHLYTIKEYTEEEKQERLKKAYAYLYFHAFGRSITKRQLKEIEGIEE